MLNNKIEVRGSDIEGHGLFAKAKICKGEFIWEKDADEKYFTQAEIDALSPTEQKIFYNYAYQVGPNQFYGTLDGRAGDDADYMNHSCDPNTWFEKDGSMSARRDIEAEEEITYDYATSENRSNFSLICRCGSPECRGTVRGNDFATNDKLQKRYGDHIMPHVRRETL